MDAFQGRSAARTEARFLWVPAIPGHVHGGVVAWNGCPAVDAIPIVSLEPREVGPLETAVAGKFLALGVLEVNHGDG